MPSPTVVGELARRAMCAELHVTPKPGLVDRRDSGSHSDMGLDTFESSIGAIHPFLVRVAEHACRAPCGPETLAAARRIGLEAEHAMFAATGGVNTHKGQIFVMVALTTSALCGPVAALEAPPITARWRAAVGRLTSGLVERELDGLGTDDAPLSHGERLYRTHGVTGIRGEAEAGFPAVFDVGMPAYRCALEDGCSPNDAAVHALLSIMTTAEDSTVVHRGGIAALEYVRRAARAALRRGGGRTAEGMAYVAAMNRTFVERGISPGGCADLLAGTIFVHTAVEAIGS